MKIAAPPEYIKGILTKLIAAGYDSYLVGGSVRDAVMNRPVKDWDIATAARPMEIAGIFPKTALTGEKFGTVTVVLEECAVEVTTFRADGVYTDGRRPEDVEFVSKLDDDLSRRDFTINAMAASVDGDILDPFGGLDDIEKETIRCVGGPNTRFSEDALRMLRALRFSAELGFKIETETMKAVYANIGLVQKISCERVRIELEKVLLSDRPEVSGEMIKIGLLGKYISVSGRSPEGLEKIATLPKEPYLRWCVFCGILLEMKYIGSATEFLHSMHLDGRTIKICLRALPVSVVFSCDKKDIKKILSRNDIAVVRAAAAVSDIIYGGNAFEAAQEVIDGNECFSIEMLAVTGRDLLGQGHARGKELGETLDSLLNHVIEKPEDNTFEVLIEMSKAMKK